jgi:hypothetical protein
LIDIFLICFGKGISLKEYAAIGGRGIGKPLSLTLCWLGTT